jgi:hypothetical protein
MNDWSVQSQKTQTSKIIHSTSSRRPVLVEQVTSLFQLLKRRNIPIAGLCSSSRVLLRRV